MKVKKLTVGPILGHTSNDLVRIFGRADYSEGLAGPRRATGVARIRKVGAKNFSLPVYFKMNPNFDMTGVAVIEGLKASTDYEYQMAWVYSDVESGDIDIADIMDWGGVEIFKFRTASNKNSQTRNLVLGSCRYALCLFGGIWFDDRGDKTFKSILQKIDQGDKIDQLIMCGDQIYADDLNVIGADNSLDEYNRRYRKAFTSKYLRRLMAQVPTYMTLDDHEIEDNWPESASSKDWLTKFPAAIHAYSTYQASHSPLFQIKDGRLSGTPSHLWYSYRDGCCDFFVCDTRTERCLDSGKREMIGPRQMHELMNWLKDGSSRVKIIVSSVPPYESESSDKWHGFIEQRDQLFECIRQNNIKKVVFLSGDVHASMSSELTLDGDTKLVSVISSAFFWPYPHPGRRSFKLSGSILTNTSSNYTVKAASKVFPTDAFTKIAVSPTSIKVEFISRKGEKLGGKSYSF